MTTTSIINHLDRALSPVGFQRKKATWNRESGQFVDVLDIQISKAKSSVTLNIGVMERDVYAATWGGDSEPFVEAPNCTVHARIGELLDGKDKWWDLQDADAAEVEIVSCVRDHAVPFLERMHSLQEMCNWLVTSGASSRKYPLPLIYLAVLRHRLGEQTEACSMLADLNVRALGAWKSRAKEVSERLGCA